MPDTLGRLTLPFIMVVIIDINFVFWQVNWLLRKSIYISENNIVLIKAWYDYVGHLNYEKKILFKVATCKKLSNRISHIST